MFASKDIFLKSGVVTGPYTIPRSVRFRSSASAYLNRTFSTPTNGSIWTYSTWVKRGTLGSSNQQLLSAGASVSDQIYFQTSGADKLIVYLGGAQTTTQVFRDPSSWYHIIVVVDTTQATNTNRLKIYVNGIQVTAFDTTNYPTQNSTTKINSATAHYISKYAASATDYIDGYLTETYFIDGQALTPSSFGATNSTTGVWQPIAYTGTYGTNGFYLKFNSYGTAAALGADSSGNSNTWTVNNLSVTAGTTYDSMTDVPTLTSATVANYCVLNPLDTFGGAWTLTDGNLTGNSSSVNGVRRSTVSVTSGKWYWEVTIGDANQYHVVGVSDKTCSNWTAGGGFFYAGRSSGGALKADYTGTTSAYGASFTTSDVIGVALDMDNGTLVFYKNNTSQGTAFNTNITGKQLFPTMSQSVSGACIDYYNFGQQGFVYTPPSGFVALNTYNLSTPTIANGAAYMAATTYTGNGSTQTVANTVNGVSFQPDFVWIKRRNLVGSHGLYDSVRGTTKELTAGNLAETTETTGLTAFGSTGFTVGALAKLNASAGTFVAWQWYTNGGSSSSNTDGTITSTVSVGATQGFSVVTYSGTGVAGTVGHGLGVTPSIVMVKSRTSANNWVVYDNTIATPNSYVLVLGTTAAQLNSATYWNTSATSSVFGVKTAVSINGNTDTYLAYCFAAVAGFSAIGRYTGNGAADGPFVYLGFRPRWIMIKRTDATSDWYMWDTSRSTFNVVSATLLANSSAAETSAASIDDLSNGFKCRDAAIVNVSTGTYLYMAFAENPFKYSLAR
jgi:hypothetical protein